MCLKGAARLPLVRVLAALLLLVVKQQWSGRSRLAK
jgi:hypothetical protein